MFELLRRLNADGKTVLYVTHDLELAGRAERVIEIRDGLVVAG
jgi:macrolide transport system ATP-binding/permease protein